MADNTVLVAVESCHNHESKSASNHESGATFSHTSRAPFRPLIFVGFRISARLGGPTFLTNFCGHSHETLIFNSRPSRTMVKHPQSQDAVESGHGSNTLCLKAD
eukprot:scaffold18305_cov58-Cyclotella_meneghiniana.AAC.6